MDPLRLHGWPVRLTALSGAAPVPGDRTAGAELSTYRGGCWILVGKSPVRLLVIGSRHHVDTMASTAGGGSVLDRGVAEVAADRYPGVTVDTAVELVDGFAELRRRLEAGDRTAPDVAILSVDDEVRGLGERSTDAGAAVAAVEADLAAIVAAYKAAGTRVIVANACTVDPDSWDRSYAGRDGEPTGLRAHRLDAMLVRVSHDLGISVVDVDRVVAEIGAAGNLDAAMVYRPEAAARITDETVAVLADYGFFDDRPLLEQVGAAAGEGS